MRHTPHHLSAPHGSSTPHGGTKHRDQMAAHLCKERADDQAVALWNADGVLVDKLVELSAIRWKCGKVSVCV